VFHEEVGSGTDGGGSKADQGPVGAVFGLCFGGGLGSLLFFLFLNDGNVVDHLDLVLDSGRFTLGGGHAGLRLSNLDGGEFGGLESGVGKLGAADISFLLVVFLEYFPSGGAHETLGLFGSSSSELSHLGSRDKFEVLSVLGFRVEELHLSFDGVESSDLEGEDLNSLEEGLVVHQKLLSVPSIVEVSALAIFVLLHGVTDTSGVSSGNEVSDTASNSGRGVPQNFSGTTIEHGGRPDSQDNVSAVNGAVVNEGLVLLHAGSERDIVILAPSSERVEEQDGVLVSLSDEVKSGLLEEKAMSIVEGVADLEGKDGISFHLLGSGGDLGGS